MTIYVVEIGEYSDRYVAAVYTSRESAERYCALCNGDDDYGECTLTEFEADEPVINGEIHLQYRFRISDCDSRPSEYTDVFMLSPKRQNRAYSWSYDRVRVDVYLTKNDPELAFKIGKDMIAKYKAEKEGIV